MNIILLKQKNAIVKLSITTKRSLCKMQKVSYTII